MLICLNRAYDFPNFAFVLFVPCSHSTMQELGGGGGGSNGTVVVLDNHLQCTAAGSRIGHAWFGVGLAYFAFSIFSQRINAVRPSLLSHRTNKQNAFLCVAILRFGPNHFRLNQVVIPTSKIFEVYEAT